jgi:iron complex transport system ATP-binding protein
MTDPAIDARKVGILRDDRWLIRDVTWQVAAGECVAIVGANGSGKSTLAKTVCGYLYPTRGELTVLGRRFGESNLNQLRESVRLVQATASIDIDLEQSVLDIVLTGFFGSLTLDYHTVTPSMRREALRHARQMGLAKVADHPFSTLSSGERVRAWIARALTVKPALLILDEPTAGLDVVAREQVLRLIEKLHGLKRHRPTIVLITHHLEELPTVTSQVLLLREGRIAASGRPRQVLTSALVSRAYRYPLTVTRRGGRYLMHG